MILFSIFDYPLPLTAIIFTFYGKIYCETIMLRTPKRAATRVEQFGSVRFLNGNVCFLHGTVRFVNAISRFRHATVWFLRHTLCVELERD